MQKLRQAVETGRERPALGLVGRGGELLGGMDEVLLGGEQFVEGTLRLGKQRAVGGIVGREGDDPGAVLALREARMGLLGACAVSRFASLG